LPKAWTRPDGTIGPTGRREQPWLQLRRFAQFLASQEHSPRDLEELTPAMVRRWRAWLPAGAGGYYAFGLVSGLLLGDERLQAGPVADALARRSRKPRSKLQSYSEAELEQVTAAARRRFRAALQRINHNAVRLQQWRDGAPAEDGGKWIARLIVWRAENLGAGGWTRTPIARPARSASASPLRPQPTGRRPRGWAAARSGAAGAP
jgi:hypothetical protein